MTSPNKVLVASGSFKDVYAPLEACHTIQAAVQKVFPMWNIEVLPMVDGGEYSAETLAEHLGLEKIIVDDLVGPQHNATNSFYVEMASDEVYIATSSIVKLEPQYIDSANPLLYTSYGLGQLVLNALDKGYTKINIGLGGTNTVDCGTGMMQALGAKFIGKSGELLEPSSGSYFSGGDLSSISAIDINEIDSRIQQSSFQVICDARPSVNQMETPIRQKIGKDNHDNTIYDQLLNGIKSYAEAAKPIISVTAPNNYSDDLLNAPFYGAAGGILYSILCITDSVVRIGFKFFAEQFNLEASLNEHDMVVTGEGKLDNSLFGKTPIGISQTAKLYGKDVIFLTGHFDEWNDLTDS